MSNIQQAVQEKYGAIAASVRQGSSSPSLASTDIGSTLFDSAGAMRTLAIGCREGSR